MRPTIIGITGTIGKTSTKEAVYEVLKTKWRVLRNPKSLNTEIGLLLAVLGQPSGFRSPIKWFLVLGKALLNVFFGKKYDFFVLEYGADKPGDIGHLAALVKPHIAIITHITPVHQSEGQFQNLQCVFEEKKKLVVNLGATDIAILNGADELLKTLEHQLHAKIFWFNGKDISAHDLALTKNGFRATIVFEGKKFNAEFPILGTYHIDAVLSALLCGKLNAITIEEGIDALKKFHLPPGRMSIIPGKYGTIILDSSYNASPETMRQALQLLRDFIAEKKIAVLGNMNELGRFSQEAHRMIAQSCGSWLDMLVTVGEEAAFIADQALKSGFPKHRIKVLQSAHEAAEFLLSKKLDNSTVILFKGSQNRVRLERAVKMLMAHSEDAKKLLCRQEAEWEKIP